MANSSEAIWQLQPVQFDSNTEDAKIFVLPDLGPNEGQPFYLSSFLINSFETGDQRRQVWVDSVTDIEGNIILYPYKYKVAAMGEPLTEYLAVFRLAEQYLIRSEAKARLTDLSGAQDDLNMVRERELD